MCVCENGTPLIRSIPIGLRQTTTQIQKGGDTIGFFASLARIWASLVVVLLRRGNYRGAGGFWGV